MVGIHSEAAVLWSGSSAVLALPDASGKLAVLGCTTNGDKTCSVLIGLTFPLSHRSVGNGLSLSRSAGYVKMVSVALEEQDDECSVGVLLGESRA